VGAAARSCRVGLRCQRSASMKGSSGGSCGPSSEANPESRGRGRLPRPATRMGYVTEPSNETTGGDNYAAVHLPVVYHPDPASRHWAHPPVLRRNLPPGRLPCRAPRPGLPRALAAPGAGRRMATTGHDLIDSDSVRPQWPDSETGVCTEPGMAHCLYWAGPEFPEKSDARGTVRTQKSQAWHCANVDM
jgi:hypothetical protein